MILFGQIFSIKELNLYEDDELFNTTGTEELLQFQYDFSGITQPRVNSKRIHLKSRLHN